MPRFRRRLAALAVTAALAALGALVPGSASQARGHLRWVALGDSYTAGVIHATGPVHELPRDGCERTTESYPQIVHRELGPAVQLRDVSCGNATIADITQREQVPIGYQLHIPGLVDIHDPDHPFDPVARQIDAVHADTDVVTVGIGGNSLGFGQILGTCIELGAEGGFGSSPCREHYTSGQVESIPQRLAEVGHEYGAMLALIHRRAPHARIITVGYPTIIPDTVTNCLFGNILQFATLRHADLTWLRQTALEPLNAMIARETREHGDTYVDIYSSSQGHSVCARGQEKWVEGIKETLGNNSDHNTWALVHPNARGQANAARHVREAILHD